MKKFNWPQTFEESFTDYHLPKGLKNTLVLADVHLPYHHPAALDEAINYGIVKNVDSILLNGDIIDCYSLSKYDPDPRNRDFGEEVLSFEHFIKTLKKALPNAKLYYKLGNHEERYERIMISRCAEFLGIPHFEFENVLKCKELGVEVIKDQRVIYIGKLPIVHGHEVKMMAINVNPARTLFLKTHVSSLCSHLHRTSHHTESSLKEDISCWSTGHLGDPHPKYARINKWNHGIARIEKNNDGDFEVINFPLTGNKLYKL